MKIALLNLSVDNNYGGNLQRYALLRTLKDLGHEAVFINLRTKYSLKWWKKPYSYTKRFLQKFILKKPTSVFLEQEKTKKLEQILDSQSSFFETYIPHTESVYTVKEVQQIIIHSNFEAIIAGSDQIWRKRMTRQLGLENYFFSFLRNIKVRKIIYSASFGLDYPELGKKDIRNIRSLYSLLDAVSVRESSACNIISQYGWKGPVPIVTLDPVLLHTKDDYGRLISENCVPELTKNKIFCYVLDSTPEIQRRISSLSEELQKDVVLFNIDENSSFSIMQWLSNIYNADYIVTDSYHGMVFSILFNKPFSLQINKDRGSARFISLMELLGVDVNTTWCLDYARINKRIDMLRNISIDFLKHNLR